MSLLWDEYRIQSITWMHIGMVEPMEGVFRPTDAYEPSHSSNHYDRTLQHWNTMRRVMGGNRFNDLQHTIVPRFRTFAGESVLLQHR